MAGFTCLVDQKKLKNNTYNTWLFSAVFTLKFCREQKELLKLEPKIVGASQVPLDLR